MTFQSRLQWPRWWWWQYSTRHTTHIEAKVFLKCHLLIGLLICTLISENQGLEKLRSVSNLRKISGPAHLDFFSVCHRVDFIQVYGINLAFFSRWRPRKKSRFAGPEIFLRFEADLDFSRPWFSEIKVQIKSPCNDPTRLFHFCRIIKGQNNTQLRSMKNYEQICCKKVFSEGIAVDKISSVCFCSIFLKLAKIVQK